MKITPQKVVETIRRDIPLNYWRSPKAVPLAASFLLQAVPFDFDQLQPDLAHIDFGLDLLERGLFKLPFPVVAYGFQRQTSHIVLKDASKVRGGMCVLYQGDDNKLSMISCNEIVGHDGRTMGAVPVALLRNVTLKKTGDKQADVTHDADAIVSDKVLTAMYGGTPQHAYDQMCHRHSSNLLQCVGLTVMLMSRGVDATKIEAPAKLNKSRAAKGKPVIPDRYVVSIKPGDVYAIDSDDGDQHIDGHRRGTVRVHWRRGHFRCLNRGTEAERHIPVAPSLIAANGMQDQIVRPQYKVASS